MDDALNVARALRRVQAAAGGGCARLFDASGNTALVVSWAPVDREACVVVPGAGPEGRDAFLTIPEDNL